jgi:hypothetical protein
VTELEERLGAAYSARTQLDLAKLTADLPPPSTALTETSTSRRPAVLRRSWVAVGAANAALLGLWVADLGPLRDVVIFGVSQFDLPWPAIPFVAWGAIGAAAWHHRRTGQTTPDVPVAIG